jgi:hypothetical protein
MQPDHIEIRAIARAIRRLGEIRHDLVYAERLRIGELLRDAADALDHSGQIETCYVRE